MNRRRFVSFSVLVHTLFSFFPLLLFWMFLFVTYGCTVVGLQSDLDCRIDPSTCDESSDGGVGGLSDGDLRTFDLPLPEGYATNCNQGARGSHSHDYVSTRFGVDLDTPNNRDDGVYAPEAGIAYVHGAPFSSSGFGYHVNIDLLDGTYLVIAHLSQVAVMTGDEVVPGSFLGIEGCTGDCTGDHVHFGWSEGDASKPATQGVSLPFFLRTRDVTDGEVEEDIRVEDLVCDLMSGHRYASRLSVSTWHPDGVLLSVPGSEDTYITDQGRLHRWGHEGVMRSYGFFPDDVVPMAPLEFDCWDQGASINDETCYHAIKDGPGYWLAYECEDDPGRYRQRIPGGAVNAISASWGLQDAVEATSPFGQVLMSYPVGYGYAHIRDGALVREESHSAVYTINEGVALPILNWDVFVALGFERRPVFVVPDGHLDEAVVAVGSCPSSSSCIDWERTRQCGGDFDVSDLADGGIGGGDHPGDHDDDGGPGSPDFGDDDNGPGSPDFGDDDDSVSCDQDPDGDAVWNCEDNCPLAHNPDQGDIDGDGLGDSCDNDIDGDGVANASDCAPFNASIGVCPESDCDDGGDNDRDGDVDCDDSDCDDVAPCAEDSNLGDDDDFSSGDDDATPEPVQGDDDSGPVDPSEEGETDGGDTSTSVTPRTLTIHYTPPGLLAPYTYIELSGEYTLASGGFGFPWTTGLQTDVNASSLTFAVSGVATGDQFRFSLEYYDAPTSLLSWGCIGTTPYSTQGLLSADVDGQPVSILLVNNFLGGCEDRLVIPAP